MNKKEVIWGFIGSFLIICLTIFYGWQYMARQTISTVNEVPNKPILTLSEIQKHNSINNCWLIINNKVYDVTKYINLHPAPPDTMIKFCGKDATKVYNTKGNKGESHSANANQLLINYYIGDLIK